MIKIYDIKKKEQPKSIIFIEYYLLYEAKFEKKIVLRS